MGAINCKVRRWPLRALQYGVHFELLFSL